MKRIVALLLALTLALGLSCLAEADASVVRLGDLTLSYADGSGVRSVRFEGASLTLAIGEPEGMPTVQASFDNGNGQMVDGVVRLAGREVQLSMGGISGTYTIDLQALAGEGNSADDTARGLTHAVELAGAHLDVVLYALTRDDGNGMRSLEMPLPMPQLISLAEAMLSAAGDPTEDAGIDGLYSRVEALNADAMLLFRYSPETGAFELAAVQNGRGMRLSGTMQLSNERMIFIQISDEEEKLDALNLTDAQREALRSELDMVLVKYADFVMSAGLSALMP